MSLQFSRRTAWNRRPNPIAARLDALRRAGAALVDLTESNPTRCGFAYPEPEVLAAVCQPSVLTYEPDPRGLPEARDALRGYLAAGGILVADEQILLTASTSEAYAYLFKLLCDPGDEVLVPSPSYPLLDFLTDLEAVTLRHYPLRFDGGWRLEVDQLEQVASERTRAVLVVSPGNPTGAFLKRDEWRSLQALCAARGWAVISDEVFSAYPIGTDPERVVTVAAEEGEALAFSLGGLSKLAALPQLKLGWLLATGPQALRAEAMARLEVVADSYLSVSAPVQRGLGRLLALSGELQRQVQQRVAENRAQLLAARPAEASWSVVPSEGGWSAILRVPRFPDEESLCLALLDRGVVVHPGFFFDFPSGSFLVLSLLPRPEEFARGVAVLADELARDWV